MRQEAIRYVLKAPLPLAVYVYVFCTAVRFQSNNMGFLIFDPNDVGTSKIHSGADSTSLNGNWQQTFFNNLRYWNKLVFFLNNI